MSEDSDYFIEVCTKSRFDAASHLTYKPSEQQTATTKARAATATAVYKEQ